VFQGGSPFARIGSLPAGASHGHPHHGLVHHRRAAYTIAIALMESMLMKPNNLPLVILLSVTAFSAAAAREPGVSHAAEHLFISPMGEPFRGDAGRPTLIATWFNGADTDHDGKLSLAEFRADADRFFNTLDTNHDGEIDPDELDRYENKIAPEIGAGNGFGGPSAFSGAVGAAHYGMLDLPEPVASADSDFNRGVSRIEFQRAATFRFRALDFEHHGQLTLADLPARPPRIAPHKTEQAPQSEE
jgi:hypothetical protein